MSNFVRSPPSVTSREMIAKLVKAGYLRPTQRNNPDAITQAIAEMKQNLRDRRSDPHTSADSDRSGVKVRTSASVAFPTSRPSN
jgi:hypothetical protein